MASNFSGFSNVLDGMHRIAVEETEPINTAPPMVFNILPLPYFLQLKMLQNMGPKTLFALYLLSDELRPIVLKVKLEKNLFNLVVQTNSAGIVKLGLVDKSGLPIFNISFGTIRTPSMDNPIKKIINGVELEISPMDGGIRISSAKTQEELLEMFKTTFQRMYNSDELYICFCIQLAHNDTRLEGFIPYSEEMYRAVSSEPPVILTDFDGDDEEPANLERLLRASVAVCLHNLRDSARCLNLFIKNRVGSPWQALKQVKVLPIGGVSLENRGKVLKGLNRVPKIERETEDWEFFHSPTGCTGYDINVPEQNELITVCFGTQEKEEFLMTIHDNA